LWSKYNIMTKIKDYENYEINELGEIWSLPKKTRKGTRLIKPTINPRTGYLYVDLCENGKIKKFTVHRLVAINLIPNPENKMQVNHINGIKSDNRSCNLEWATHSENQKHSITLGLRSAKGIKNSQAKLTEDDVKSIRNYSNTSLKKIASIFGVSIGTISDVRAKKTWQHLD